MTTNFTSILNENIDMFDTTEIPSIAEEAKRETEELQEAWDEEAWCEEASDWLRESMDRLLTLERGTEAFESEWAMYSDLFKDVHGHRPSRDSVESMRRWLTTMREHCPEVLRN